MAFAPPASTTSAASTSQVPAESRLFAISIITALFFMWGFITSLNDILIPHLKSVFHLDHVESSLVQVAFFGAYFLVSIPVGKLIAIIGYRTGMVSGLLICGLGSFLFYPAAALLSYPLFLAALFILAGGVTVLQVTANPYISILGPPATASSRLNLAQGFNSLGTTLAPFIGGRLILSGETEVGALGARGEADLVQGPYLFLGAVLVVMAIVIKFLKLPSIQEARAEAPVPILKVLRVPHVGLGALAIFFYVGAEVSIGSFLIDLLKQPALGGFTAQTASHYVSYYWALAMIGRFIGALVLQKLRPPLVLSACAIGAIVLLTLCLSTVGMTAVVAVTAVGLFNSIMFPTIFTLGIAGMGARTGQASSLLIMAIVGGALLPLLTAWMADEIGIHLAFIVPALCYLYILFYGAIGWKPEPVAAHA